MVRCLIIFLLFVKRIFWLWWRKCLIKVPSWTHSQLILSNNVPRVWFLSSLALLTSPSYQVSFHLNLEAVVVPLLKKHGLECNNLKNFQSVSNLPFISKLLERVVLHQLQQHLFDNNLLEINQSVYRKGHSVETAALSVMDSLLTNSDEKLVSLIALLDLSAAFDTLDHSILLRCLEITFGISGNVLKWFCSYVSQRFQSVIVNGSTSNPHPLLYRASSSGLCIGASFVYIIFPIPLRCHQSTQLLLP